MKINTDGVLLGAIAEADKPKNILDIGTGTGVIALMLAQRFSGAYIDGVEIDESTARTAQSNFANSPFADKLCLHTSSFEMFFKDNPEKKYDLIVSNPPFYINSLHSAGAEKKLAKHAGKDFFKNLIAAIQQHLNKNGLFWLIVPIITATVVKKLAADCDLHLQRSINIKSYPTSAPHREMLVFGIYQTKTACSEFIIYDEPKQYSGQYHTVLKDFLTIFP